MAARLLGESLSQPNEWVTIIVRYDRNSTVISPLGETENRARRAGNPGNVGFQMIRNGRDRSIPILSGSASAFEHGRWHGKEVELLVKEVGMTPVEAIAADTSGSAALLGLAGEIGVIAPVMLADIVIWNRDPIADITVLQRPDGIAAIIKDGRVIDRRLPAARRGAAARPAVRFRPHRLQECV
jgi:hypothetical protein